MPNVPSARQICAPAEPSKQVQASLAPGTQRLPGDAQAATARAAIHPPIVPIVFRQPIFVARRLTPRLENL
jgi:hypothetical protein